MSKPRYHYVVLLNEAERADLMAALLIRDADGVLASRTSTKSAIARATTQPGEAEGGYLLEHEGGES